MPITEIPEKTNISLGREKTDAPTPATVGELLALLASGNLDYLVPAAEFERIKDGIIELYETVGLSDGTTVDSIHKTLLEGMQGAYDRARTIAVTAAKGFISIANSADATDLIRLARSFAGGGDALDITMATGTTGRAIDITMDAGSTGRAIRATVQVAQDILFGTDGTKQIQLTPSLLDMNGGRIRVSTVGDGANPSLSIGGDTEGLFQDSGALGLSAGGAEIARITGAGALQLGTVEGGTHALKMWETDSAPADNVGEGSLFTAAADGSTELIYQNGFGGQTQLTGSGAAWARASDFMRVEKPSDETITSSAVLQDDDALVVTLLENEIYYFKLSLFVNVESGTPGIKVAVGGTLTADSFAGQLLAWDSTNALVAAERASAFGTSVALAAGDAFVTIEGSVEVANGGGGTLALKWAQATSDADDTTVQRNSTLEVRRCA